MRPLPELDYDAQGVRRVARALLRHVKPGSRTEAYAVLENRLGVYVVDRTALRAEIDYYFGDTQNLAA